MRRRIGCLSLAALLAATALPSCVANPGSFTIWVQDGSFLSVVDGSGTATFTLDIGSIGCDDAQDNDRDGLFDHNEDPECASATDANERVDGVQPFVEARQPVTIDAAGTITYEPTELVVPSREFCLDFGDSGVWCIRLTIKGIGSTQTGSVAADGVTLPLPIKIEIDAVAGFDGLGPDCEITPISGSFEAESYDGTTGASRMVADGDPVPTAANCGSWTEIVNYYLQLPALGNAVMETTILDGGGQPVQFS